MKIIYPTIDPSQEITMVINDFDGLSINEFYDAAAVYLGSKNWPNTAVDFKDSFAEVNFNWKWVSHQMTKRSPEDIGSSIKRFELRFTKRSQKLAINSYLPFVLEEAKNKKEEMKTLKIFTMFEGNKSAGIQRYWKSENLDHPVTLDMFPMQVILKRDHDKFLKSREEYRKNGRVWKRGYLIYGPPGTGKTTLVAAMANFLNFHVYVVELSYLKAKWELRNLLMNMERRSIVVVENIQPTNLQPQEAEEVTLLDLVKLMDGLWSSFGDEKILIFTTSHKVQLPHAFCYPGRIDAGIELSYCSEKNFRFLANKYLGLSDHELLSEIDKLIRTTKVTPAQVVNQFRQKNNIPDVSLGALIKYLQNKGSLMEIATGNQMTDQVEGQASMSRQGVHSKNEGTSGMKSADEEVGKSKQVRNPANEGAAQGPESMGKQGLQNENEGILANKPVAEEVGKSDDEVSIPQDSDRGSEKSKQQELPGM